MSTSPPDQPPFAVLIPVGPAADEPDRLLAVLASLRAHVDPASVRLIVVDDAPQARHLEVDGPAWLSVDVIRTDLWNAGTPPASYDAMTAGTLAGLRVAARRAVRFVLKLDTDAWVIAPFEARVDAAIAASPEVAVFGSYTTTASGGRRDFSVWESKLGKLRWPIVRHGRRVRCNPRFRQLRPLLAAPPGCSVPLGGHCLGGAYVVTPALLAESERFDASPWRGTSVGEDVVVGTLARGAGLALANLTGPGEVFAIAHVGLSLGLDETLEHDTAIIHATKNDRRWSEAEIRDFFGPRPAAGAGEI